MDHIGRGFNRFMQDPRIQEKYRQMIRLIESDQEVRHFLQEHQQEVTREMVENSYSKLYEYIQEKEKIRSGKPSQNPGYEPHLAVNAGYIDVVYRPTAVTVAREKERELRGRIHSIAISKDVRQATMSQFAQTKDRLQVINEVLDFLDQYDEDPKGKRKALYLVGPFGVGKTYLLGALAYELALRSHLTTLMHYPTFTTEMKQSIHDNTVQQKIDAVKTAEILMLDDIGAEANSTWIRDEVLGVILQYRMQEDLPTFFSSNLTMDELEEHFRMGNKGDDEPIKAKRLMERIRYLSKEVAMTGKNRRHEDQ